MEKVLVSIISHNRAFVKTKVWGTGDTLHSLHFLDHFQITSVSNNIAPCKINIFAYRGNEGQTFNSTTFFSKVGRFTFIWVEKGTLEHDKGTQIHGNMITAAFLFPARQYTAKMYDRTRGMQSLLQKAEGKWEEKKKDRVTMLD